MDYRRLLTRMVSKSWNIGRRQRQTKTVLENGVFYAIIPSSNNPIWGISVQTTSHSFRCSPELSGAIKNFADQSNRHVSSIIREAVETYLKTKLNNVNFDYKGVNSEYPNRQTDATPSWLEHHATK
jgi:hypothetical protein